MISGTVAVCRRGGEGFACSFNVFEDCSCVDAGGGEGFASATEQFLGLYLCLGSLRC